jgi:hypothetical protein
VQNSAGQGVVLISEWGRFAAYSADLFVAANWCTKALKALEQKGYKHGVFSANNMLHVVQQDNVES